MEFSGRKRRQQLFLHFVRHSEKRYQKGQCAFLKGKGEKQRTGQRRRRRGNRKSNDRRKQWSLRRQKELYPSRGPLTSNQQQRTRTKTAATTTPRARKMIETTINCTPMTTRSHQNDPIQNTKNRTEGMKKNKDKEQRLFDPNAWLLDSKTNMSMATPIDHDDTYVCTSTPNIHTTTCGTLVNSNDNYTTMMTFLSPDSTTKSDTASAAPSYDNHRRGWKQQSKQVVKAMCRLFSLSLL